MILFRYSNQNLALFGPLLSNVWIIWPILKPKQAWSISYEHQSYFNPLWILLQGNCVSMLARPHFYRCTAHQMEIFAQEFDPASYFCDWTCVHLIMSGQKQGPISENKLPYFREQFPRKLFFFEFCLMYCDQRYIKERKIFTKIRYPKYRSVKNIF